MAGEEATQEEIEPTRVQLPKGERVTPLVAIGRRIGLALAIVLVNWLIVVLERGQYNDTADGDVSLIDALYYTTVTLSTTGYGDITPITESARLLNALLVTPMRLLFVIILVGTTIQALTERSREQFRLARWRSRLNGHVVVLGYGTMGRNAVREVLLKGTGRDEVIVVDEDPHQVRAANADGLHAVCGSAVRQATLLEAHVGKAASVIVALDRDDSAVLAVLATRRLAPGITVVAAARESENAELLKQSGATSVIVSSETTGRMLGLATGSPDLVAVVQDLVSFGRGLDLLERDVGDHEVGSTTAALPEPVFAVIRDGVVRRWNDPSLGTLRAADRVVYAGS